MADGVVDRDGGGETDTYKENTKVTVKKSQLVSLGSF